MNKRISLFKNVVLSNLRRLPSPYKATFALTYRCNSKCRICHIWGKCPQKELGVPEIEKIFKSFKHLCWVDLTGGEVTLREDLNEVVRGIARSAKKLMIAHVSTNGQLPDRAFSMVEEILKARLLPVINVSVDGPQELHDELRGVPGSFSRAIETFRKLKKLRKGHYYLSCTISKCNIRHVDELLLELKKAVPGFTLSDIHFNLFHTSSHYYGNQGFDGATGLDPAEVKKYLSLSKKGHPLKSFLENEYMKGVSRFLSEGRPPMRCQALNATCFVDPSGKVYPCGIYDKALGDLAQCGYDIERLWNRADTFHAWKEIGEGRCPGCWSPCEAYPAIMGSAIKNCFLKNGHHSHE